MRLSRLALVSASVLAAACGTDGTTSSTLVYSSDPRLSAVAAAPTASLSSASVAAMELSVTNALPEAVSGGVCAQVVEARAVAGSSWSDVTASVPCAALAVVVQPGSTTKLNAYADQAKVRSAAGSGATSVVLRVKAQLAGASTTYTLQSNEVTWQLQ